MFKHCCATCVCLGHEAGGGGLAQPAATRRLGGFSRKGKRILREDDEAEEAGLIGLARGFGAPPVIGDQCWGKV